MSEETIAEMGREITAIKMLHRDIQKYQQGKLQLQNQQAENEIVLQELSTLSGDTNVYKLIGTAFVKQDLAEAKTNVATKLDVIKTELERVEAQSKSLEEKAKDKTVEIQRLQKKMTSVAVSES